MRNRTWRHERFLSSRIRNNEMHIAEIIPFPNQLSNIPVDACEPQAVGGPSAVTDTDIDQMLQARARIRKVLDELDRLNGELSQLIVEG